MVLLGQKVRDLVTGFEGIAVTRAEFVNGCPRIGIRPIGLDKDGKVRDHEEFDETQVEVIDPARIVCIEPSEPTLDFGQDGEDKMSGFKGKIVGMAVFLNGCRRIALQPPVDKKGNTRKLEWFDEGQIKSERLKAEEKKEANRRTGGPGYGMPTTNKIF